MRKIIIKAIILIVILFSSCTICFAQEKIMSFARPEDYQVVDPYDSWNTTNRIMDYMIYDRLIEVNPDSDVGGYAPSLATEWEVSTDGLEYTFKLRSDVKFHNGETFNAQCVKENLERFLTEKSLKLAYLWENLKEVEVIDEYTVKIKLNAVTISLLDTLSRTAIFAPKAFREQGIELFENPIGSGAFVWGHWDRAREIVVHKNPDYWGKPAYMDTFRYLVINESGTRLAGSLTGEIDICDFMNVDQIPLVEQSKNVKVIRYLSWDQIWIGFKMDREPFTDIKFREAVALAINKEDIRDYVLKGGRVSTGIMVEGTIGFDPNLEPIKRDVEKAKQLLKDSVYDGRIIELMVPIGWYPSEREVAQVLKENLEEIGIKIKLTILEGATYAEKRAGGDFDMLLNQGAGREMDNFFQMRIVANNMKLEPGPELVEMALKQGLIVDEQERTDYLRKIERKVNEDFGPIVPVVQFEYIFFQQAGIEGARYFGDSIKDFRYAHYTDWVED